MSRTFNIRLDLSSLLRSNLPCINEWCAADDLACIALVLYAAKAMGRNRAVSEADAEV